LPLSSGSADSRQDGHDGHDGGVALQRAGR
jgi:hypothetical protein